LTAPHIGWIAANWDAALDRKCGKWGMGVVVRDKDGEVIAATSSIRGGFLAPADAEALAALAAIQLCGEQGHDRVIFMGDVKSVVDAVNSKEQDWSRGGNVTEAIQAQLRSHPFWSFTYSCREANRVAHVLARLAIKQNRDARWSFETPTCVQQLIVSEKPVLP
jgi:ribonuclease HI